MPNACTCHRRIARMINSTININTPRDIINVIRGSFFRAILNLSIIYFIPVITDDMNFRKFPIVEDTEKVTCPN